MPPAVEKPTWTAASSPGELRPAGPVSTPEQGRGRRAAGVRSPARRAPPALVAAPCRVVRPLNPSAWEQKVVSPVLPVIPGSLGPSPRLGRLRYLRRRLPVPAPRAGSREQAERWQLEEWDRSCPIRMGSSWARWSSTSRRLRGRPGRRGPWGVRASPSCRWWEPAGVARRREPSSAGRVQQQPRLRSPTDEANPSYTSHGTVRSDDASRKRDTHRLSKRYRKKRKNTLAFIQGKTYAGLTCGGSTRRGWQRPDRETSRRPLEVGSSRRTFRSCEARRADSPAAVSDSKISSRSGRSA